MELTCELNNEYIYRYDKDVNHKSWDKIRDLPLPSLIDIGLTRWARAMPDECKIGDDVVSSYRNYYNTNKLKIMSYKKREKPFWITQ